MSDPQPQPRAAVARQLGPYDNEIEVPSHPLVEFVVLGQAKPAGSKSAFPLKRKDGSWVKGKDGRPIINVADASKGAKPWKGEIKAAAEQFYTGPVVDCPLVVEFTFFTERGNSMFRSGKSTSHLLTPSARLLPTTAPDALKLARAVEDALTGLVWKDDALIVDEVLRKRYGSPARCEVAIRFVEHVTVGDWEEAQQAQQKLDVAA